jgi:hypothetical protein
MGDYQKQSAEGRSTRNFKDNPLCSSRLPVPVCRALDVSASPLYPRIVRLVVSAPQPVPRIALVSAVPICLFLSLRGFHPFRGCDLRACGLTSPGDRGITKSNPRKGGARGISKTIRFVLPVFVLPVPACRVVDVSASPPYPRMVRLVVSAPPPVPRIAFCGAGG